MLGIASLLSRDPITAFDLHSSLWREIKQRVDNDDNLLEGYQHIKKRLPIFLVTGGVLCARYVYTYKPSGYIQSLGSYLDVVQEIDPNNYAAHLLRGIYYFVASRDINRAKEEIKKAKNERDDTWQYSAAFLEAYDGDLGKAHKIYKRAFKGLVQSGVPVESEVFIADVLGIEPSKIQLWYCLGMINYFSKVDLLAAKGDFEEFLAKAKSDDRFAVSVQFAERYLSEINHKLN